MGTEEQSTVKSVRQTRKEEREKVRRQRWAMPAVDDTHGDEVQRLLLERTKECLDALWPSELRAPHALTLLHDNIHTLFDYTMRTPRGRAMVKRNLLERMHNSRFHTIAERDIWGEPNDLLKHRHAHVVPGIEEQRKEQRAAELRRAEEREAIIRETQAKMTVDLDSLEIMLEVIARMKVKVLTGKG